jgi:hypothetical protein
MVAAVPTRKFIANVFAFEPCATGSLGDTAAGFLAGPGSAPDLGGGVPGGGYP